MMMTVGAVEALWEDDELCASCRGLIDLLPGVLKVLLLVGPACCTQQWFHQARAGWMRSNRRDALLLERLWEGGVGQQGNHRCPHNEEEEEEEHTELEASDFEVCLWHGNPPVAAFTRLAAGR
jgi:hypothetical protein